jgi:hypothetical protein
MKYESLDNQAQSTEYAQVISSLRLDTQVSGEETKGSKNLKYFKE